MATRADFEEAIDSFYDFYWDGAEEQFGNIDPVYPKVTNVKSISDIEGSFTKDTSGVGMDKLKERDENEPIELDNPAEGYTVQLKKRTYDLITPASFELSRDFHRAKDFLKNYIKENAPGAVMRTKDSEAANLFNKGFQTGGDSIFNNSTKTETDSSGDLIYDSAPFFAKSGAGTLHTSQGGNDYYNALDTASLTYDNLVKAHKLLVDSNAYMENDEPFDNSQNKVLMVKPGQSTNARRLIESERIPESQNNDINPVEGEYRVVSNPYLSNDYYWFVGRSDFGVEFYDMKEPIIDFWQDKDTRELRAYVGISLALGVKNFRGWVGSDATS